MKKLSLTWKFAVCLGIVLILFIFSSYCSVSSIVTLNGNFTNYNSGARETYEEIFLLDSKLTAYSLMVGNSVLTEDAEQAELYIAGGMENLDESFALIELIGAHPSTDTIDDNITELNTVLLTVRESSEDISQLVADNREADAYDVYFNEFLVGMRAIDTMIDVLEEEITDVSNNEFKSVATYSNTAQYVLLAICVITLVISIFLFTWLIRYFLRQIRTIEGAVTTLSEGRFELVTDEFALSSKDEFGALLQKTNGTVNTVSVITEDLQRVLKRMSEGDFTVTCGDEEMYIGEYASIRSSLSSFIAEMNNTLTQVKTSSSRVADEAEQVSHGANSLAVGATDQASSVEELTSTIIEISGKISENAKSSETASEYSLATAKAINDSNTQMQQLMEAMYAIDDKSKEIRKIIGTIENIAFQTNILALNAAVEAARAGEAGRGFAVVAEEVRNLAGKSAEASSDTSKLISSSLMAIDEAVKLAKTSAENLNAVVDNASDTSGVIAEISAANSEQADSMTQITMGLDRIALVVQTNTATSEESASASQELLEQAELLKSLANKFELSNDVEMSAPVDIYPEYTPEVVEEYTYEEIPTPSPLPVTNYNNYDDDKY